MRERQKKRRLVGSCVGVALLWLAPSWSLAQTGDRIAVLRFTQEIRGLQRTPRNVKTGTKPQQVQDKVTLQELTVDADGRRLLLQTVDPAGKAANTPLTEGASRVVVRMDREPPEIFTLFDAERQYRAHKGDLNEYQDERDITEDHERRRILSDRSMSKSNQDAQLARSHLRRDGKRLVTVKRGGKETILGYECEEVTVTENGRVILHAWITTDLGPGSSFYQLYRRLGTFSRQVLEEIKSIQGVPLRAKILVVTAAPARKLEVRCTEVHANATVPAGFFEIPKDYKEFEKTPAIAPCPICRKKVERDQPGGIFADPIRNVQLYFCSRDCRNQYIEFFKKRRRAADGQKSGSESHQDRKDGAKTDG